MFRARAPPAAHGIRTLRPPIGPVGPLRILSRGIAGWGAGLIESRQRLWSRLDPDIFTSMGEYRAGVLDRVFSAVSDPTRRAILARLADSDARVTDVARTLPISLNSTSKHIRVLEAAGLVQRRVRGREHILTLDAAPLAEAADWIDHYRTFWSQQLASLDAFVTARDDGARSS